MLVTFHHISGSRAGQVDRVMNQQVISAGRAPHNMLRFDQHQDLDVSSNHASISWTGLGFSIVDNGSANGTFVNGNRVQAPTPLQNGTIIEFGAGGPKVRFSFDPNAGNAPPPPAPAKKTEMKGPSKTRMELQRVQQDLQAQQKSGKKKVIVLVVLLLVLAGGGVGFFLWYQDEQAEQVAVDAKDKAKDAMEGIQKEYVPPANEALENKLAQGDAEFQKGNWEAAQKSYEEVTKLAPEVKTCSFAAKDMTDQKKKAAEANAEKLAAEGWKALEAAEASTYEKLKADEYTAATEDYKKLEADYKTLREVARLSAEAAEAEAGARDRLKSLGIEIEIKGFVPGVWQAASQHVTNAKLAQKDRELGKAEGELNKAIADYKEAKRVAVAKLEAVNAIAVAKEQLQMTDAELATSLQAFDQGDRAEGGDDFEMAAQKFMEAKSEATTAIRIKEMRLADADEREQDRRKQDEKFAKLQDQQAQRIAQLERELAAQQPGLSKEEVADLARKKAREELEAEREVALKEKIKGELQPGIDISEEELDARVEEEAREELAGLDLSGWYGEHRTAVVFILAKTYVKKGNDAPFQIPEEGEHMGVGVFINDFGRILTTKSVAQPWRFNPKARAHVQQFSDRGFQPMVQLTVFAVYGGVFLPLWATKPESVLKDLKVDVKKMLDPKGDMGLDVGTVEILPVTPGNESSGTRQVARIIFGGDAKEEPVTLDHPTLGNLVVMQVTPYPFDEEAEIEEVDTTFVDFASARPAPGDQLLAIGFATDVEAVGQHHRNVNLQSLQTGQMILTVAEVDEGVAELVLEDGAAPVLFGGGPLIDGNGRLVGMVVDSNPETKTTRAVLLAGKEAQLLR